MKTKSTPFPKRLHGKEVLTCMMALISVHDAERDRTRTWHGLSPYKNSAFSILSGACTKASGLQPALSFHTPRGAYFNPLALNYKRINGAANSAAVNGAAIAAAAAAGAATVAAPTVPIAAAVAS